ncbi:MAG: CehA/McbA family metallohydrolase [bacterium]
MVFAQTAVYESLGLLFLLYAETHYAFKGVYSRLKKREPEIVADLPHRMEAKTPLPILLMVKDADRYPVALHALRVHISSGDESECQQFELGAEIVREKFWHRVFECVPQKSFVGATKVDVAVEYEIGNEVRLARNDNYACSSHAPFEVYISDTGLPKTSGWHLGEFHCHTAYTNDQVEFGAPVGATAQLARRMGLSFYCATDHSYDLDDCPNDYLKRDPLLTRWTDLRREIEAFNASKSGFVIVPGEEVSCGNQRNRNVHFLILNHSEFLHGAGDSAEKWLHSRPESTVAEILQKVSPNALAYAAHPEIRPPLLQRLLLRRGKWHHQDYQHQRLNGMQIWNGTANGLKQGKQKWVQLLLEGRRLFISGGNDAHGNFNRFRQIGFPFFTMRENHEHLFGKVRTGVFLEQELSLGTLLDAIGKGRMVVTDGPFAEISLVRESDNQTGIGESAHGRFSTMRIRARSSPEFGALSALQIYRGDLEQRKEMVWQTLHHFAGPYCHEQCLPLPEKGGAFYYRAELYSQNGEKQHCCLTNPIWVRR